jgi:hypothetical protein
MIKCNRCGTDNPPWRIFCIRVDMPQDSQWDFCEDCYLDLTWMIGHFCHKSHGEIEFMITHRDRDMP